MIEIPERRGVDENHKDIRDLILSTEAPKDKAMLLILLKISDNLEDNTALTLGTKTAFESHEEKEQKMLAKATGAWWVLSGLMVMIIAVFAFWAKSGLEDFKILSKTVQEHAISISDLRKDVHTLQERNLIHDESRKDYETRGR